MCVIAFKKFIDDNRSLKSGAVVPPAAAGTAVAVLRTAGSARQQRLIPGGAPGPFVPLPPTGVTPPAPGLGCVLKADAVAPGTAQARWPELTWPVWTAPVGGRPWSFGRVQPVRDGAPSALRHAVLQGGTEVWVGALP